LCVLGVVEFCFAGFQCFVLLIRIVSQNNNQIGADGARAVADAIRVNSSVQLLSLVRSWFCLILLCIFSFIFSFFLYFIVMRES
jgi:hypothetical protein